MKGDRPCHSRFEVVTYQTADRSGAPFEMMMETLNAFRAINGKGPIAPWWKSRICTTYIHPFASGGRRMRIKDSKCISKSLLGNPCLCCERIEAQPDECALRSE